jgi:PAS domain S-box-containing protein
MPENTLILNQSITKKITIVTVIIIFIVSLTAVIVTILIFSQSEKKALEHKADETLANLVRILEMPLWTFNHFQVEMIGKAVFQDESIVQLLIRDDSGAVIYSFKKTDSKDLLSRSCKITHKQGNREYNVGEVSFSLTQSIYKARNRQLFLSIIVIILIILICIAIVTNILIRTSLKKPLHTLNEIASSYAMGLYNTSGHAMPYLEFQPFGKVLSEMAEKIREQISIVQDAEKKYRDIVENAIEGIFQSTLEGRYLSVNPAFAKIMGYDTPETLLASINDIGHQIYVNPADRNRFLAFLSEQGAIAGYEIQVQRKNKKKIWISIAARMARDNNGQPLFIEGFISDISDRKQAQDAFAESLNFLNKIINSIADPLFVKDRQHRWVLLNDSFCNFMGCGRETLIGKNVFDLFPEDLAQAYWSKEEDVFKSRDEKIDEDIFTDAKGIVRSIVTKMTLYQDDKGAQFIVGIISDITERKRLEIQLRQSQKMEAIGTLAGGIAHDFNNILGGIIGYTELTMDSVPKNSEEHYFLTQVKKAGERAKDLVKQILLFSRQSAQEKELLKISPIIEETLKLLRASLPTTISVKENLKAPTAMIFADRTQIHQILMNLGVNAAYAMREKGGLLEVDLEEVSLDHGDLPHHPNLTPGAYVKFTVSDTGHGMDQEVMSRIFEPFFTTKEVGEGTGMGLAVVHGIVKSNNGEISVASRPGAGTTFTILLPKIASEVETASEEVSSPFPTGNESILFIDDEEMLTRMIRKMLTKLGYRVVVQSNSAEALKIFRSQPEKFDLIITDQTMPQMTGMQLARECKRVRPDIPIILCTGHSEKVSEETIKAAGINLLLMKPIVMRNLAETIRRTLENY